MVRFCSLLTAIACMTLFPLASPAKAGDAKAADERKVVGIKNDPVAMACVARCADDYLATKVQSDRSLADKLEIMDVDVEACFGEFPTAPKNLGFCLQKIETRRRTALDEYQTLLDSARTAAWTCYRECLPKQPKSAE